MTSYHRQERRLPLVLDADALWLVERQPEVVAGAVYGCHGLMGWSGMAWGIGELDSIPSGNLT